MAENCEKCKFRAHYDKGGTREVYNIVGGYQPNSFLGKFWRWHINFCPGWKGYFSSQSKMSHLLPQISLKRQK